MKKIIVMLLLLSMVFCVNILSASAGTGSAPTATWEVSGYTLYEAGHCGDAKYMLTGVNAVKYGSEGAAPIDAIVDLKYTGSFNGIPNISVTRGVDSFNGGTILSFINGAMNDAVYGAVTGINNIPTDIVGNYLKKYSGVDTYSSYSCFITNLKYKGVGNNLSLIINTDGEYQDINVDIVELKAYEDPGATMEPYALFTVAKMPAMVKPDSEFNLTVNIKNKGKTDMLDPVVTVEPSASLLNLSGQDSFELSTIKAGETGSLKLKLKTTSEITGQMQSVGLSVRFDYDNGTALTEGNTTGKVSIPCDTKSESGSTDSNTASPVPNLIITGFNYGGKSVAAGSDFNFGFTFKNTSKNLDVENIVVTVESAGFTPNGATNTFYYSKLGAGKSISESLPMKAGSVFQGQTENITLNFTYEYVDKKVRTQEASDLKVSVPVYQKDRFEITPPIVPAFCYEGEEMSITMDYVNKGKSSANNVEARIEGDITSPNPTQIIGNIESGRNGQFAFALTPNAAGECNFTVTVTYEDANENIKERVFPVTMNVEAAQWDDPGQWEDPGIEPEPEKNNNLWKYIVAVLAAALIAFLVVMRKKKKSKAIKQEANQWKAWEEEFAKEEAASDGAADSDTGAGNGTEKSEGKEKSDSKDGEEKK